MDNKTLKEMHYQMSPDREIVERLYRRLEQESAAHDEIKSNNTMYTTDSRKGVSSDKKPYRRAMDSRIPAAAAILVVLIAGAFLLNGMLGGLLPDQNTRNGAVVTNSIIDPADYDEIYDALMDASGNNWWFFGSNSFLARDGAIVMTETALPSAADKAASPQVSPNQGYKANQAAGEGASTDYSGTNVQVEGIDEGDIVKTDGAYIYVLRNEWFIIFKASGAQTEELSRMKLIGNSASEQADYAYWYVYDSLQELYIHGSFAFVVVNYNATFLAKNGNYEYDMSVTILCIDISNPKNPVIVTDFFQSGYYNSSRLQGTVLYVISNQPIYENMKEDDPGSFIPWIGQDGIGELVQCTDIRIMPIIVTANHTVITSIDVVELKRIDQKSILGSSETIYMSYDNLYLASSVVISEDKQPYTESVYIIEEHSDKYSTQIARIALDKGMMDAVASCTVDGILLNQFSLDEYEGNLRLAVTIYSYSYRILRDVNYGIEQIVYGDDNDQTNALYILGPSLEKVGSINGLAKNERIYSVRFSGPVAYMVTFRQVDPLFAMDLSDPNNPKVTSELKIPGFSTYLHPFGTGKLLGLGYDVRESRITGMKMSMFDISDPFDISENDVELVGTYSSEALSNHKAVLVDVQRNIIGFAGDRYGAERYYYLYGFSEDSGFEMKAKLKLGSMDETKYYGSYQVRGFYIDSYLYVYSGDSLDVFSLISYESVKSLVIEID